MRIAIEHHTTRAKAKKIVEKKIREAEKQYSHHAGDFEWNWEGDTLYIQGKAKGMTLKGTLEITDTDVIVDGKVPLLAKPFESRIRHAVEREAEAIFRTA